MSLPSTIGPGVTEGVAAVVGVRQAAHVRRAENFWFNRYTDGHMVKSVPRGAKLMIVVRNTFTAKPGQASKLAAQVKEMASVGNLPNHRVLTDVTGEFNRVVLEYEVESAVEFEELFRKYSTDPQIREKAKGYTDLWMTGSRELWRIV